MIHPKLLYYQGRISKALGQANDVCSKGLSNKPVMEMHIDRLKDIRSKFEMEMDNLDLDEDELGFISMIMDEVDDMELQLTTRCLMLAQSNNLDRNDQRKLPKINFREFDEVNPDVWFMQLENQLLAHAITSETDKFVLLEGFLNTFQALIIQQLSANCQNESHPYTSAKKLLLDSFALTLDERLNKAMKMKINEDERPSQFLSRFKLLFRDTTMDQFLQWIVRKELPRDVVLNLMNKTTTSVDDFVKSADVLMQAKPEGLSNTNVVQKYSDKPTKRICFYHSKFGEKSTKCDSSNANPCSMFYLMPKKQASKNLKDGQ